MKHLIKFKIKNKTFFTMLFLLFNIINFSSFGYAQTKVIGTLIVDKYRTGSISPLFFYLKNEVKPFNPFYNNEERDIIADLLSFAKHKFTIFHKGQVIGTAITTEKGSPDGSGQLTLITSLGSPFSVISKSAGVWFSICFPFASME